MNRTLQPTKREKKGIKKEEWDKRPKEIVDSVQQKLNDSTPWADHN